MGCAPREQRLLERRLAHRTESAAWAAKSLAWREQAGPERLARDFEYIGRWVADDARKLDKNLKVVGERIKHDFERWEERQPLYREKLAEILLGDPAEVPSTAIIMFF